MSFKPIRFLLFSLVIYTNVILPSIISGTLIKTPHGLVAVKDIPSFFFVRKQELLTNNAAPVIVIGLTWLFGEGLKFAVLSLGTAIFGSYVGVQVYNTQKQKADKCHISFHVGTCGSPCPDPDDDKNNERKFNTVSKSEFFKMVKDQYEHYKNGVYRRKKGAKGIENAEFLEWDHLHGDVEAYAKSRVHLGSINPQSLKIYKNPVPRIIKF